MTWQLNNNITTLASLSFFCLNYFPSFLLPPLSSLPLFHFPQIQIINVKKILFSKHFSAWPAHSIARSPSCSPKSPVLTFLSATGRSLWGLSSLTRDPGTEAQSAQRRASPWLSSKESAGNAGNTGSIPGSEDPLEEGMATGSSILA